MADWRWSAIDAEGRTRSGSVSADSEEAARAQILARGLYPVSIAVGEPDPAGMVPGNARMSAAALALFTRQLATLSAVSPVEEALAIIARQSDRPATRAIVEQVRSGIAAGARLSAALSAAPRSFDAVYRATVAAGDGAGKLTPALERLALLIERQAEVRTRLIGALAYPLLLALFSVLVVAALMILVVPRMADQFAQSGAQLPWLTRVVAGAATLLAKGWPWLLGLLVILCGAAWLSLADPARRQAFDRARLHWPLAGRMLRDVDAARFARTLSTLVAARVPLFDGLGLAQDVVRNHALKAALVDAQERVRGGASLSSGLADSGMFPPLLTTLAASGESAGQLDIMLDRAADTLEREVDGRIAVALALLEPLVIVMMGVAVALIILSVLLPVLQMESLVAL